MEKPKEGQRREHNAGITLIALIITIIILLILAIITIRILMNQGIIRHANDATSQYKIAEEKEKIALGYQNYKMDKVSNPNAELTVDGASEEGSEAEGGWTVTFDETGNVYELDTNGNITQKKDSSQDEIAKIRAGYNKYQSDKENNAKQLDDEKAKINKQIEEKQAEIERLNEEVKNNINQEELDLLTQYCVGNNDKDLVNDILDIESYPYKFKGHEPIPNAENDITYTGIDQDETDGNYIINIYFKYNGNAYKLISAMEYEELEGEEKYNYPTKKVERVADTSALIMEIEELQYKVNNMNQIDLPKLEVEGAIVNGEEQYGWYIEFSDTGNKYNLSSDGTIEQIPQLVLNKNSIILKINTWEGNIDDQKELKAILKGGLKGQVTWSVSDENIIRISNNIGETISIKPVKAGTVKIIGKCEGYTAYCSVTVEDTGAIGEYINYDCYTGVDSSLLTYTSLSSKNGYSNQTFTVSENPKWKIIGKNDNGNILITTSDATKTLNLTKRPGYSNGIDELDNISKLYGHGKYAISARSIIAEDVNKITNYTPGDLKECTYTIENDGYVYRDGVKGNYTKFLYYDNDPKEQWKSLNKGASKTMRGISYDYRIGNASKALKMISYCDDEKTQASYWLANRSMGMGTGYVRYDMFRVVWGKVQTTHDYWMYSSRDSSGAKPDGHGVRPVVVLSPNVTLGEKVDDVWQIIEK